MGAKEKGMLCLNVSSVVFSVKRQSSVVWNNSPKQQSCDYLDELNKMKFLLARHAGLISVLSSTCG